MTVLRILQGHARLTAAVVAMISPSTSALADAPEARTVGPQPELSAEAEEYTVLIELFGEKTEITYQKIGEDAVIGGDTVLGTHVDLQRQSARNAAELIKRLDGSAGKGPSLMKSAVETALADPGFESALHPDVRLWPSRRMPYRIDQSVTDPALIKKITDSVDIWNSFNIVSIVPAKSTEVNILTIRDAPGEDWYCQATLGYRKGPGNWIKLNAACNKGAVIHEFAHALGLMHEHQRPDRNQFLTVEAFVASNGNYTTTSIPKLATAYDLCSIVHYSEWQTPVSGSPWFSLTEEGKKSLSECAKGLPQRKECQMVGQRCQPSEADLALLTKAYGAER